METRSPSLQADSLQSEPPEKPKNNGVGSLSLLQRIFPTQDSNPRSPIAGGFFISWGTMDAQSVRSSLAQTSLQIGTTIPSGPCGRRAVATMRLRSGAGLPCVVPANSCGSPPTVEFCVPWRRLILPSCPSCLSFITEGSFPTANTIAGSTMAEVMEAGRGVVVCLQRRVRRFWEGTLEWQYEVPPVRQALCWAPSFVISSPLRHLWGANGPREDVITSLRRTRKGIAATTTC